MTVRQKTGVQKPVAQMRNDRSPFAVLIHGGLGFLLVVLLSVWRYEAYDDLPRVVAPTNHELVFESIVQKRAGNEIRIFTVGASLTAGFPYQPIRMASYARLLGEGLSAVLPGRKLTTLAWASPALDSPQLDQMVQKLLAYDPSLICVSLGSNEFVHRLMSGRAIMKPQLTGQLDEVLTRVRVLFTGLSLTGSARAGTEKEKEFGKALIRKSKESKPGEAAISALPLGEADRDLLLARMRLFMRSISKRAKDADVPLVFLVACYGLGAYWPLGVSRGGTIAEVDRLILDSRDPSVRSLSTRLERLLARYPLRADLQFLHGRLLHKAGKAPQALAAFKRARDLDTVPMHLTGAVEDCILETAKELGRPCFKLDDALASSAQDGIPQSSYYLDYGHLSDMGHLAVAAYLAERLAEHGLLPELPWQWEGPFIDSAKSWLDAKLEPLYRANAQSNMAVADATYSMLFGNHREALPYLVNAYVQNQLLVGRQGVFANQLLYCLYTLLADREEVGAFMGLPAALRSSKVDSLFARFEKARKEGRLPALIDGILRGDKIWPD